MKKPNSLIKCIYEKPTSNIILNGETEHFHLEISNRARMSSSHYSIEYHHGCPNIIMLKIKGMSMGTNLNELPKAKIGAI